MKETTTMTNPKGVKERNTKIISTGLAIATGIGIVGVIGFRSAEDANAQNASGGNNADVSSEEAGNSAIPTLDGYSAEQLQAYAEALQQEAARLSEYRDQLNAVAKQLAATSGGAVTVSSQPSKSAKATPKVAPVPPTQKQPAPQTNSQGSG